MKKYNMYAVTIIFLLVFFGGIDASAVGSQGNYIKDGSIVKITKKNYDMWGNFSWKTLYKTKNYYNKKFEARGRYNHKNGSTYYSLYDSNGRWYGYLNKNATVKTSRQGDYISDGSYVTVIKDNYNTWSSFGFNSILYKGDNLKGKVLKARGRYEHFNGSTYYSLYDNKGKWYGYIDSNGVAKTSPQGGYSTFGKYIEITKSGYNIFGNFNWKILNKTSNYVGKSLYARGKYEHFNGNKYYSLYDDKNIWLGYIDTSIVKLYTPKEIKNYKDINVNQSGKELTNFRGYIQESETVDEGKITTSPNGDRKIDYIRTIVWKVDPNYNPIVETKQEFRNIDIYGNELYSTKGYKKISESKDFGVTESFDNGDSIVVYTTTITWQKEEDSSGKEDDNYTKSYRTKNVDIDGKVLKSTIGYEKVKESTDNGVLCEDGYGNIVKLYTTTITWKKSTPPSVVVGEWNGVYYAGLGNSGRAFPTDSEAYSYVGDMGFDDPSITGYTTWKVRMAGTNEIWTTVHFQRGSLD